MLYGGLQWEGPVVWWQPVEGWRHALHPEQRPLPGQERETLCGERITLIDPTDVDWLMPTCDTCMSLAVKRSDERCERERAARERMRTAWSATEPTGRSGERRSGGPEGTNESRGWSR